MNVKLDIKDVANLMTEQKQICSEVINRDVFHQMVNIDHEKGFEEAIEFLQERIKRAQNPKDLEVLKKYIKK